MSGKNKYRTKGVLTPLDDCILDTTKYNVTLRKNNEVFVQVSDIFSKYYISNDGRVAHVDTNNTVKILKETVHSKGRNKVHYKLVGYDKSEMVSKDFNADYLVAQAFLVDIPDKEFICHIDGNRQNSYFKNLIYVSKDEKNAIERGDLSITSIAERQCYLDYAIGYRRAYSIYHGIYLRTVKNASDQSCYDESIMCKKWIKNPSSFVKWYEKNYYECDGESMAVDKDLLCKGNKIYSPETCCVIPQTINTMLSNCKKHYGLSGHILSKNTNSALPLGVRYNRRTNKYYGVIRPCGGETVRLNDWDTAEEAFREYKRHKEADILIMADLYKSKLPDNVYKALVNYEVEPF